VSGIFSSRENQTSLDVFAGTGSLPAVFYGRGVLILGAISVSCHERCKASFHPSTDMLSVVNHGKFWEKFGALPLEMQTFRP